MSVFALRPGLIADPTAGFLVGLVCLGLLVPLCAWITRTDMTRLIVPDTATGAIAALGIVQAVFAPVAPHGALARWLGSTWGSWAGQVPWDHLMGGLALGGFLLTVSVVGAWIAGRTALGFGDVKLGFAIGVWTAWQGIAWFLLAACLCAGLHFAWIAWRRHLRGKRPPRYYPFAPGLCGGLLMLACFGLSGMPVGLVGPEPLSRWFFAV